MKDSYVTDTMALILRLERRKLSSKVKKIFARVEKGRAILIIPAMVLAEIGYLSERKRIDTNLTEVKTYCSQFETTKIQPMTEEIVEDSFEIDDIPELHDRIIAGTAKHLHLKLITNDPVIATSQHVTVIW